MCRADIANLLNKHHVSQSELIQQFHKEYETVRREEMLMSENAVRQYWKQVIEYTGPDSCD